jgi:hypothetical protein
MGKGSLALEIAPLDRAKPPIVSLSTNEILHALGQKI